MAPRCPPTIKSQNLLVFMHFVSFALLFMPVGLAWYFGNVAVYLDSYWYSIFDTTDFVTSWIISIYITFWSIAILVAGATLEVIGHRAMVFIGILLFQSGFYLSYLTVQYSQICFVFSLGCLSGLGFGVLQTAICMKIPKLISKRVGMAFAIVNNYFNLGSIIFNWVITSYTNPLNLEADVLILDKIKIFSCKSVVDRVPSIFLILGVITSALQFTGYFLTILLKDRVSHKTCKMEYSYKKHPDEINSGTQDSNCVIDVTTNQSNVTYDICPSQSNRDISDKDITSNRQDEISEKSKLKTHVSDDKSCTGSYGKESKDNIVDQANVGGYYGDLNVFQILKLLSFYVLWFTVMANDTSYIVLLNFYKMFGELWIADDHFLTDLGMASLCCVMVLRLGWAWMMDRFGVKTTQVVLSSSLSLTFVFYYFLPQINQWLYACMTCLMAALCSAVYLLCQVSTLKLFGTTNFGTNFGAVTTSTVVLNLIAPQIATAALNSFGWPIVFLGAGVVNVFALAAIVLGLPNQ